MCSHVVIKLETYLDEINPTTSNLTYVDIKEVVLTKEWNSSHLSWKKLNYLHLKNILKYEYEQHCKIIATHYTSNHRLVIETRQCSTIYLYL